MVRATVAFAVIALGAAAVIAQAPEGSSQLEIRELNNDLEVREYATDDLEARGDLEGVDLDAREPELFFEEVDAREPAPEFLDDIEAREYEAEELEARDFEGEELKARTPDQPSKTVTTTVTPTPTACTQKELKSQKGQKKVDKALAVLRSAKGKKDLSSTDKQQVKKARKYLRRVRSRKVRAAKRTAKKCGKANSSSTSRKAVSSAKCEAASRYLQRVQTSKSSSDKSKKKTSRAARKSGKLLAASKTTVGADGVTTVTVNAGPTCTPTSGSTSRLRKRLTSRDIVDGEFDSVFAREYDFDNLD